MLHGDEDIGEGRCLLPSGTTPAVVGQKIGDTGFEKVTAKVVYDIYKIVLKADEGIANVYLNGQAMFYGLVNDVNNTGGYYYAYTATVSAGDYKVTYTLKNGWSGEAKLTGETGLELFLFGEGYRLFVWVPITIQSRSQDIVISDLSTEDTHSLNHWHRYYAIFKSKKFSRSGCRGISILITQQYQIIIRQRIIHQYHRL